MNKALIVGINYLNTPYELSGCVNDTILMHDLLVSQYGYLEKNILTLTNSNTTRNNLLAAFSWLLTNLPAHAFIGNLGHYNGALPTGSTITFFYSGHGILVSNPINVNQDAIVPVDFKTAGVIQDQVLRDAFLNTLPANVKLITIFDSCHSGTMLDLKWTCIGSNVTKSEDYQETTNSITVIAGSINSGDSYDVTVNGRKGGALTYSLTQVLAKNNYSITSSQLCTQVTQYIQDNDVSKQIPEFTFGRYSDINDKFSF